RNSCEGGLGQTRRLPVVRGDAEILEQPGGLGEPHRCRDRRAEVERRRGPRPASEQTPQIGDVLALLTADDAGVLPQLSPQPSASLRRGEEGDLELLQDERRV